MSVASRSYAVPLSTDLIALECGIPATLFRELANEWKTATKFLSSTTAISMHPAYQQIIGMGNSVLPLIFADMQNEPAHWFMALKAITGENPIKPDHRGRMILMTADWLQWGRERGLVQ